MEKFEVIVIGAGPGGYPAAIRVAQLGRSVALVEREQLGGTCLNSGCIPTKLFINAAELYHSLGEAEKLGIKAESLTLDYATLARQKDSVLRKLRGGVGSRPCVPWGGNPCGSGQEAIARLMDAEAEVWTGVSRSLCLGPSRT